MKISTSSPYANSESCPIASAKRVRAPPDPRAVNSPLRKPKKTYDDSGSERYNVSSLRFDDDDCEDKYQNDVSNFSDEESPAPSPQNGTHYQDENVAVDHSQVEEEDDEEEEFNPFLFMHGLPPHSSVCIKNKICLPPPVSDDKVALVLDLDETLVHCTIDPIPNADFVFPVTFNDVCYEVYVRKRPYVDYFLKTVCKEFEVIVFTASQKVYANKLLDRLDPDLNMIRGRLFREACLGVYGNYIKDLSVLNRDLAKTVLVDNSPYAYGYHIDNGIPIESWFDDDNDTELLKLIGFLRCLQNVSDVRPIVRDHFKTHKLVEEAGAMSNYRY